LAALLASLAALALGLLAACDKPESSRPPAPTAPVVHTDVATVQQFVALPGITAARWIEEPRVPVDPRTSVPGPTDYALSAYVEVDASAWPALETTLGGPTGTTTLRISERRAALLFPPSVLATRPRKGDEVVITASDYNIAPLRRGARQGEVARRVGAGLLMTFFTM
jgi:hypothetical protein